MNPGLNWGFWGKDLGFQAKHAAGTLVEKIVFPWPRSST